MNRINLICPKSAVQMVRNCMLSESDQNRNVQFFINGNEKFYDGVIVLQSTSRYNYANFGCKVGNSLLVVMEPEDILRMTSSYLDQFDHILTPNRKVTGKNTIRGQFGQLWSFDKSRESLLLMRPPSKTRVISTVTSTKVVTKGHSRRLELLRKIQTAFPDQLDWFGRGVREIDDKWEALEPYRYHLVFENGQWPDYWTEKLTDAYLGYTMPIYLGCQNIEKYFSAGSMIKLESTNPEIVIPVLTQILEEDTYAKSLKQINIARDKIINEYSLFCVLSRLMSEHFNLDESRHKEIDLRGFKNIAYRSSLKKVLKRGLKKLKM